jgi:methionyl-tRNA formyltransferase
MVARVEEPIQATDTTGTLEPRLARSGATLLATVLDDWVSGTLKAESQDDALATYAPQLKREEALLDWSLPAADLWRRVRAFNPWPIAFTHWRGDELRILESWPLDGDGGVEPGTALGGEALPPEAGAERAGFCVQTGEGRLAVITLQRAGRRPISGAEFLRGQRDILGAKLG